MQTTTGARVQEGAGLGLPISRKFIQLMGGDISVSSEIGKGATFEFHICVHDAESAEISLACPTRRVVGLAPGQRRKKILIADDNPDNRTLLFSLLQPFGFDLREANNGKEAVEIWRGWKPDLIWMDIRMPVMDGYEAVKVIRGLEKPGSKRAKTIIIAQTASTFEEEHAKVIEAGCDDFLRKPFNDADVFNLMEKQIGVQFIHEDADMQDPNYLKTRNGRKPLKPEDFSGIPDGLLGRLKQAAIESDMDKVDEAVHEIRSFNADLANKLERLAYDFEYIRIINAIEDLGLSADKGAITENKPYE